jgi:hypothetical protein
MILTRYPFTINRTVEPKLLEEERMRRFAPYAIAVSTAFDAITGKTWSHVPIEEADLDKSEPEFPDLADHCMLQETLLRHIERRSRKR